MYVYGTCLFLCDSVWVGGNGCRAVAAVEDRGYLEPWSVLSMFV